MKYFDKNKKKHRLFYVKKQGGEVCIVLAMISTSQKRFTAIKKNCKMP